MEHYLTPLTTIATAAMHSEEKTDIFTSLGIDWTLLGLQTVAFLILVALLAKFVYPVFMRTIDARQEAMDASVKAAKQAEEKAETAQDEIAKLLKTARQEAADIVATAKDEAASMVMASEEKAKSRAEKIVADAHEEIEKDVIAARKQLRNDTIDLVALATEKVVGNVITDKIDDKVIASAIKESE